MAATLGTLANMSRIRKLCIFKEFVDNVSCCRNASSRSAQATTAKLRGAQNERLRTATHSKPKKEASIESRAEVHVGNERIEYEFLEDNNKIIGSAFLMTKSRKERTKHGLILLEGQRLMLDAFEAGARLQQLFFSGSASQVLKDLRPEWLREAKIFKVRYRSMKLWSDVHTPQGVCGIFEIPKPNEISHSGESTLPLTLICDNIREPGNMGALLRSAAAVGCERVLATKGCVSVWEPKVLRAAMGGHFHVPILADLDWERVSGLIGRDYSVYLADSSVDRASSQHFESAQQQAHELLLQDPDDDDIITERKGDQRPSGFPNSASDNDSDDEDGNAEYSSTVDPELEKYRNAPLVTSCYYDMAYTTKAGKRAALVVGGETQGLSAAAFKLAFDRYGCRVHVPMSSAVDSLNSAVAAGILMFEIKRQHAVSSAAIDLLTRLPRAPVREQKTA